MRHLILSVARLFSATSLSAQVLWNWPVDSPQVGQVYACLDCAAGASARYAAAINIHTGVDLSSASYVPSSYNTRVRAAADGTIASMVPVGSSHGLGNAMVIAHANGLYSLYGHLESFAAGLSVGSPVARAQQIGIMGNSGDVQRDSFPVHVHFEIKNGNVLGNPAGSDPFWGYTPGHPDQYGYLDPRTIINNMNTEYLAPTVVQNPARCSEGTQRARHKVRVQCLNEYQRERR